MQGQGQGQVGSGRREQGVLPGQRASSVNLASLLCLILSKSRTVKVERTFVAQQLTALLASLLSVVIGYRPQMEPAGGQSSSTWDDATLSFSNCTRTSSLPLSLPRCLSLKIDRNSRLVRFIDELFLVRGASSGHSAKVQSFISIGAWTLSCFPAQQFAVCLRPAPLYSPHKSPLQFLNIKAKDNNSWCVYVSISQQSK